MHSWSGCAAAKAVKVAVAAADFPYEFRPGGEQRREGLAQRLAPLPDAGEAGGSCEQDCPCQGSPPGAHAPLPDPIKTIRILISAGLTPLIRLACPSVYGLNWVNFKALSFRNP